MTILDQPMDAIRTARLVLRSVRESDAEQIFPLFNNWDVMRYLSSPPWPYALDDARGFVGRRMNEGADSTRWAA